MVNHIIEVLFSCNGFIRQHILSGQKNHGFFFRMISIIAFPFPGFWLTVKNFLPVNEEKLLLKKVYVTNLTAYDFYLRGKDEVAKLPWPQFNTETLNKAVTFFRKALAYDSSFAKEYSSLGGVLWTKLDLDQTITDTNIRSKLIDSMLVLSDIALSYDNLCFQGRQTESL